jgi:hypothetical protein
MARVIRMAGLVMGLGYLFLALRALAKKTAWNESPAVQLG